MRLHTHRAKVDVIYHTFLLIDVEGLTGLPEGSRSPFGLIPPPGRFLATCPNGAVILSNYDTHLSGVVFEVWDGPATDGPAKGEFQEDTIYVGSGAIVTANPAGGDPEPAFELGGRGLDWTIRVHRIDLHPDVAPGDESLDFEDRLEDFVLQFWPSPRGGAVQPGLPSREEIGNGQGYAEDALGIPARP